MKSSIAFAQSSVVEEGLSAGKMKARAEYAIKTGDVYTALFYYEEVVRMDSSDTDARFKMAEMHRLSRNYARAAEEYSKVYSKEPFQYSYALYYQAQMQKMCGKYEEAKSNFLLFRRDNGSVGDKNFKLGLAREIAGCDSAMSYREFPDNIKIENSGSSVNNPHAEFSPFMLDDQNMIFGSLRMDSLTFFEKNEDHIEETPTRQLYKAKKENGMWREDGLFETANDHHSEMGNITYSFYTDRYYFTKCHKDKDNRVICKLFYIERNNGKWSEPVALPAPINIEGYSATQPTIVVDTISTPETTTTTAPKPTNRPPQKGGKAPVKPSTSSANKIEYLYFVSDRPEGKGGMDIWYTYYNTAKKVWVDPINLMMANTSETECTPFYHVGTQTMYFSSNGQTSAGGLDIFKMKYDGKRFAKPQNLSFPINSPQDDLGFTLNNKGNLGFLVSNRIGGTPYFHETCCDDIYNFEILPVKPFDCTLSIRVINSVDTMACSGKKLTVIQKDLKTSKSVLSTVQMNDCSYMHPLKSNQQYKFTITLDGFDKDTLAVETRDMCAVDTIKKELMLNLTKKEIVYSEVPVEGKPFVLKDIQYETNQAELTDDAKIALDSVLIPYLKEHPTDKVLISAHTDDQGSHKYNQALSQNRADNVVKYLVSKGVDGRRLQAKGYGETKPVLPNQNPDGSDNPIARSINRRTEFLFLKQ